MQGVLSSGRSMAPSRCTILQKLLLDAYSSQIMLYQIIAKLNREITLSFFGCSKVLHGKALHLSCLVEVEGLSKQLCRNSEVFNMLERLGVLTI